MSYLQSGAVDDQIAGHLHALDQVRELRVHVSVSERIAPVRPVPLLR